MNIYKNSTEHIGNTPLVFINKMNKGYAKVAVKLENRNPMGSIKDRIALSMINDAESRGLLKPGGIIVEPTSGNTGIGLAFIAAIRGYRLMLTMPETMSLERRKLLQNLGAGIILTEGPRGMQGAIDAAQKYLQSNDGSFMPMQFSNPANPKAHESTTAPEIWIDTSGQVDCFVASVGTGGTVTGTGRGLKAKKPGVRIIAVEPAESPVLSTGKPGPNRIQGIGAGFVPDNFDRSVVDEILTVSADSAGDTSRELAKTEGIFAGMSSGANVFAALELSKRPEYKDKLIVTVICDTGERYLSTWLYQD